MDCSSYRSTPQAWSSSCGPASNSSKELCLSVAARPHQQQWGVAGVAAYLRSRMCRLQQQRMHWQRERKVCQLTMDGVEQVRLARSMHHGPLTQRICGCAAQGWACAHAGPISRHCIANILHTTRRTHRHCSISIPSTSDPLCRHAPLNDSPRTTELIVILCFPLCPGGVPSYFTALGADYNMGGPHTLGDLAAGIEWAPTLITASPAVLAASQTKRQSALPLAASRASTTAAAAGVGAGEGSGRHSAHHGRMGRWNLGRWA